MYCTKFAHSSIQDVWNRKISLKSHSVNLQTLTIQGDHNNALHEPGMVCSFVLNQLLLHCMIFEGKTKVQQYADDI